MAGPTITFVTDASDEAVAKYFAAAQAFIFPNHDDFGITPVEAMAAGTPVIAFRGGGALDYVKPGKTGQFFDEPSVTSLVQALERFNPADYSSDDIKNVARGFSRENFVKTLQTALHHILQ
jgi:glycosyltransferase involved in cell wall biosynthesis